MQHSMSMRILRGVFITIHLLVFLNCNAQDCTVNAGQTFSICELPQSSLQLVGLANDPNGSILSTIWSQISGPNTATIVTPSTLTTAVDNYIPGTYVFRLTAQCSEGDFTTDDVSTYFHCIGY